MNGVLDSPLCTWVTGSLDFNHNNYAEGNNIPDALPSSGKPTGEYTTTNPGHVSFRGIIRGLDAGTYDLTIKYQFTKGGKVGYDFLTTNYGVTDADLCSELPSGGADPITLAACSVLTEITGTFPLDTGDTLPSALGGGDVEDRQSAHTTAFSSFTPRTMKVYGASGSLTITNLARTGIVTGDSEDSVKITFTKSTGSSSPIIATWGGHLGIGTASSAGYGSLNGAGSITGASFHMTLDKLVVGSGADNLPSGNRARSIQSNAINPAVPPSSIETLEWEKRVVLSDGSHPLIGGATFSISPDPATGTGGPVAVSDCTSLLCLGLDQDDTPGQFLIDVFAAASPGTAYTVTETTAPTGTAIDADADRSVTVTSGFGEVIGTQTTDDDTADEEGDLDNTLGSIAWEKRTIYDNGDHLLFGGATFTVTPDPTTGSGFMTVVDNGANDADPADGSFLVVDVLADDYEVEETDGNGAAIDADPDRDETVTAGPDEEIGTQTTDDDTADEEADFHNTLGMIAWEKRTIYDNGDHLLFGGATFTVTPDPTTGSGFMTVVDNDSNDADPADGSFLVVDVLADDYEVEETDGNGAAIDADPDRDVTVAAGADEVIGTQTTDDDTADEEADFHNTLGMIAWEKRTIYDNGDHLLFGGATFTVTPDPTTGSGFMTVVDNGANDADPADG